MTSPTWGTSGRATLGLGARGSTGGALACLGETDSCTAQVRRSEQNVHPTQSQFTIQPHCPSG
ncbi:MAG: hypothetical protein QM784_34555 [Polyangiaceae bacterium]